MRSTRGFSLIELLIVVAIILIIAAIAIPSLLQAKISANEASAVGSLRAMTSAEAMYFNAYPTIGYATGIAQLGGASPCTPSSTTACLIDSFLAISIPGSSGKSGYIFQATGILGVGTPHNDAYVIGATPITMYSTGNHDYCSTNDGVLRSQIGSPGDTPVTSLEPCLAFPVAQ
jgi:type IV pilus assembly protein PilA